jgi:hypothetical protein
LNRRPDQEPTKADVDIWIHNRTHKESFGIRDFIQWRKELCLLTDKMQENQQLFL